MKTSIITAKIACGVIVLLALTGFSGCSTLTGGTNITPKTFNQSLATGYEAVGTVADLGTALHQAGVLSDADASNVLTQDTNLKAGLDVARSMHASGTAGDTDKLTATLSALTALQTYINSRKPTT